MSLGDPALLVDDISDAAGVFVARAVEGPIGHADPAIGVAQQGEGKIVFLGEASVVLDLVDADAKDLRVLRFVFLGEVPEPGTLGRSPGGVGFREKPKDNLLTAEVAQLHAAATMIGRFEIGSWIARFEHE